MSPWELVNLKLISKSLSELHFEEVLIPHMIIKDHYEIELHSGVTYSFEAKLSAWNHLWVNEKTIKRTCKGKTTETLLAGQFFIDSQVETKMSDITLANFLEEMNKTLYSDLTMALKTSPTVDEMVEWSGEKIQNILNGHPKLLLNKGRMGWDEEALHAYAPENNPSFRLRWILVDKTILIGSETEGVIYPDDIVCPINMKVIPVHPWQWSHVIVLQFQAELQSGHIIDLGERGDTYQPQISLRTLTNLEYPESHDIKLPLSILNTSCVRGLPHNYLTITSELSLRLKDLISQDELLSSRGVDVLAETSAWGVIHSLNNQIEGAPYRYHELLGAVARESVAGKLKTNEKGILAASLIHQDSDGRTLLGAYAHRAGISISEWMKEYTKFVIIPLLHLQSKYGVGLVAHGQNVVVRLKDFIPSGLFLKDFHGDLRLSNTHVDMHKEFFPGIEKKLTRLPPEHLIHDLVTGHFVTVLRFIAGVLSQSCEMAEKDFYAVITQEVKNYYREHPNTNLMTDVLAPSFQRVLVNSVRFKIGYGDSSLRPLPILGSELTNPLFQEYSL